MNFKLTYNIGKLAVQEWTFHNRSLAYWMKSKLLSTGNYDLGCFKVKQINVLKQNK